MIVKMMISTQYWMGALIATLLLILSSCGFYLRGSPATINVSSPEQAQQTGQAINLVITTMSAPLQDEFLMLVQGVPQINVVDVPMNVNQNNASLPSHKAMLQPNTARLVVEKEEFSNTETIVDATALNKENRLTYRLRYSLVGMDNQPWTTPYWLERRTTYYSNELDRLGRESKAEQANNSLYREMARSLLQAVLSAPRPTPTAPSSVPSLSPQ